MTESATTEANDMAIWQNAKFLRTSDYGTTTTVAVVPTTLVKIDDLVVVDLAGTDNLTRTLSVTDILDVRNNECICRVRYRTHPTKLDGERLPEKALFQLNAARREIAEANGNPHTFLAHNFDDKIVLEHIIDCISHSDEMLALLAETIKEIQEWQEENL